MREKKRWLIITFHTTAAAIAMEKLCRAKGLPGRLIPVPRELTADCGMVWRAGTEDRAALTALTKAEGLETDGFMSCCCEEYEKGTLQRLFFILSAASCALSSRGDTARSARRRRGSGHGGEYAQARGR
ncbi:MAG: DUF3343 domain-containing protein [Oscillospiraceae bacterium]